MDLKITPEQFQEAINEQREHQHWHRKQDIKNDLKAFAILVVAFASIIFSAEFVTPMPLFLFCIFAFVFILKKNRR